MDEAKVYIAEGADVNATYRPDRLTPLHYAAQNGHVEMGLFLLTNSANAHAEDVYGHRPLHLAAASGCAALANALIERGADVRAKASIEVGAPEPLHKAAESGSYEVVELLLQHKADVACSIQYGKEWSAHGGQTPLTLAALRGHRSVVELLIKNGALPNIDDAPLHAAASGARDHISSEHDAILSVLIDLGANPDSRNSSGRTPLHVAGSVKAARVLIDEGATVDAKAANGETPLHTASSNGLAKLLLSKGADPNAKNRVGDPPLREAILYGNLDLVKLLVKKGAHTTQKMSDGITPFDFACELAEEFRQSGGTAPYNPSPPHSFPADHYSKIVRALAK